MKRFLKSKKKFLAVIMVMVFVLTGCSNPRGESGKTYVNSIIASEDVEVKRSQVDLPDDKEIQKKYKDMKPEDIIQIKKTTFGDAMSEGWFNGLIVWPIAQLINITSSFTDAGVGIIITTLLIQFIIFLFSIKSQVATQKMQSIQPDMLDEMMIVLKCCRRRKCRHCIRKIRSIRLVRFWLPLFSSR